MNKLSMASGTLVAIGVVLAVCFLPALFMAYPGWTCIAVILFGLWCCVPDKRD